MINTDERWYEDSLDMGQVRNLPPPLPARHQSQSGIQRKENDEVLIMAKKWEEKNYRDNNGDKPQKLWVSHGKKWSPDSENIHTKVQTSHSLPMNHGGYSLPIASNSSIR